MGRAPRGQDYSHCKDRWKTYRVQRVHQVLDLLAVRERVHAREEDGARRAEDEEAEARFLGEAPPFVGFFQVDEGVDGEDELGYCEREDYCEYDSVWVWESAL